MVLISKDSTQSQPFKIPAGKQLTLLATGLTAGDKVTFELVSLTSSGPSGDPCCPGQVVLPDVAWSVPFKMDCGCDGPVAVELTAEMPWKVLHQPQEILMRATVVADPDALVELHAFETAQSGSCLC